MMMMMINLLSVASGGFSICGEEEGKKKAFGREIPTFVKEDSWALSPPRSRVVYLLFGRFCSTAILWLLYSIKDALVRLWRRQMRLKK